MLTISYIRTFFSYYSLNYSTVKADKHQKYVKKNVLNTYLLYKKFSRFTFFSMNFLAHIYLSGNDDSVILGNFIADGVKGNNIYNYPEKIQYGITLHRHIDSFTDTHPITKLSKERISALYEKHSGIAIDIFYDHFLAANWTNFSREELRPYVYHFYFLLLNNFTLLPPRLKRAFPFMVINNWFKLYSTIDGVENVLMRMSKFTSLPDKTKDAMQIFKSEYSGFRDEFYTFFEEIKNYVSSQFNVELPETIRKNL